MPRSTPLPLQLALRPFAVREGIAAGLSDKALRGSRFVSPHRGVRDPVPDHRARDLPGDRVVALAAEYLPLLREDRGELFSHTTALMLVGAPLRAEARLHVSIPLPHGAARGRNVRGHNTLAVHLPWIVPARGLRLPCAPPEIALLQSASVLSFRELVVAADHLILPRGVPPGARPLVARERLIEIAGSTSVRGVARLRAALEVARAGAESRMETLQHFELARMGLDTLELQAEVRDRDGRLIGRFDAVHREKKLILEYDGEQHRTDRAQYLRDLERLDAAREAGYRILRFHKEDFHPARLARTRLRMCAFLGEEPRRIPYRLAMFFAEPLR